MSADNILAQLYEQYYGSAPAEITLLAGAGSHRKYYRLSGDDENGRAITVIGTIGTDTAENEAFIALTDYFTTKRLPVPTVLCVSDDRMAYLQTDCGDLSLFEAISHGRATGVFSAEEVALLTAAIRVLPELQFRGGAGLDFSVCYPSESLDSRTIVGDLHYFKYDFLKPSGLEFSEQRLDDELEKLAKLLHGYCGENSGFMVRDFQSRNVMICNGKPYVIDYQGGRRGPAAYDVASFLWQAKANIPDALKQQLINEYIAAATEVNSGFDADRFRTSLPYFVLFRMLQTLGAYGFRGMIEGKPHFIQSITPALSHLQHHLSQPELAQAFPYLLELASQLPLTDKVSAVSALAEIPSFDGLTVTVSSFSYKKGLPVDLSGNGGGFDFDCRAIHNPGRYEQYKQLTGRDEPVRKFLEDDGEILEFLGHVEALVDASVTRYLRRGFTALSVNFGCTGGQHRSVYSAEAVAHHIREKYPQVRVVLYHREQKILQVYQPSNQ